MTVGLRLEVVPGLGDPVFQFAAGDGGAAEGKLSSTADTPASEADVLLQAALARAVASVLSRGPQHFYPVVDARVVLTELRRSPTSTAQGVVVCVTDALRKLLAKTGTEVRRREGAAPVATYERTPGGGMARTQVLEPWMRLEVIASTSHTGPILSDIRYCLPVPRFGFISTVPPDVTYFL